MKNLLVFSRKLDRTIPFTANGNTLAVVTDGLNISLSSGWQDKGWNNTSSWMDKGWNNTGNWSDKGWNNTGNWSDKGWNNTGNWSDSGWSNGGSGCFISTAVLRTPEVRDDCYELETLRFFRDTVAAENEDFREMILDYYKIAPMIVQAIERDPDKDVVYNRIRAELVEKCIPLIEDCRKEEAIDAYMDVVCALKKRYNL